MSSGKTSGSSVPDSAGQPAQHTNAAAPPQRDGAGRALVSNERQGGFLDKVLREGVIITVLVAVIIGALHWFLGPNDTRMFTQQQLERFTGVGPPKHSKRIYLAILGSVFDVTEGRQHYGVQGNYHGAAGRDSSTAFITGNFTADQSDDLAGFKPEELASVYRWRNFFRDHMKYTAVGRVAGRYYTSGGQPTEELQRVEQVAGHAAAKTAESAKQQTECSVQWSGKGGKTVWCPNDNGYPRRIADADTSSDRCVCAPTSTPTAVLGLYKGCDQEAHKCRIADLVFADASHAEKEL